MGAPGWTSFCRNGHIVETCGHHQIMMDEKTVCDLCGAEVIGAETEWGDDDYGPHDVPYIPIRHEVVKITREYNGTTKSWEHGVSVYDVSKILARRSVNIDKD